MLSWYALFAVAVFEIVRLSALSLTQGSVVHIGPGLYCCTLASAVGTAAATLRAADRWLAQCADPWIKTRTPWLPSVVAGAMLVALPVFGLLGHDSVHQPALSVTAHRVAPGTRDGSVALGRHSRDERQRRHDERCRHPGSEHPDQRGARQHREHRADRTR